MPTPIIDVASVSTSKISRKSSKDQCIAKFSSNVELKKFEVRADGAGLGQGLLVEKDDTLFPSSSLMPSSNLYPHEYNLLPLQDLNSSNPNLNITYSTNYAWDKNLNPYGIGANGWSSGYNGGVQEPEIGYHAHLRPNYGPAGENVFEFINHNTQYGHPSRWLGISKSLTSNMLNSNWIIGTEIEVTLDVKVDVLGRYAYCGLYHKTRSGNNTFGSEITAFKPNKANEWQTITKTFKVQDDWMLNNFCNIYIYGHYNGEGIIYVANPKIVIGKQTIIIDDEELTNGDKNYSIDIYGQAKDGVWNG